MVNPVVNGFACPVLLLTGNQQTPLFQALPGFACSHRGWVGQRTQIKRDTTFATPGYSVFCYDSRGKGKKQIQFVCGQSCGQSGFAARFCCGEKSSKHRCCKDFRALFTSKSDRSTHLPKEEYKELFYNILWAFVTVSVPLYMLLRTLVDSFTDDLKSCPSYFYFSLDKPACQSYTGDTAI